MTPGILSALDVEHGLDYDDDLAVVEDYEPWPVDDEQTSWDATDRAYERRCDQ